MVAINIKVKICFLWNRRSEHHTFATQSYWYHHFGWSCPIFEVILQNFLTIFSYGCYYRESTFHRLLIAFFNLVVIICFEIEIAYGNALEDVSVEHKRYFYWWIYASENGFSQIIFICITHLPCLWLLYTHSLYTPFLFLLQNTSYWSCWRRNK